MDDLSKLSHDRLVAIVGWMAQELSEWITSESVESGHGFDKCRTPEELIGDAIAATETGLT